jgi:dephospho-CoA kinase
MRKPICIGVTGGIGSGKSIVCKIFNALGVLSYDADSRAKIILNTDEVLKEQIKDEFGPFAYDEDGKLNRGHISKMAFSMPEKLARLNQLVHPRVAADIVTWTEEHRSHHYLIKEAALLFETGSYKELDKVILVSAPQSLRIERVLARDPYRTEADLQKIMANQMSEEEKMKRADFVIVNDESELLIPQVLRLHDLFSNMEITR